MDIQARNEAIGFCKKYIDEHGGGGGETSSEIATIVNKLGAKNLLINVGADSARNQGVDFTKNADGTVSATRVESADNTATYNIVDSTNLNTDHYANLGEVILSGTPADGSANMCVMLRQTSGTGHIYYNGVEVVDLDGTGALVDLEHCTLDAAGTTPIGRDDMRIIVRISKTTEPNNVVFKPMLRYKDIEDGTYVPYVKTNAEATKDLQDIAKGLDTNMILRNTPYRQFYDVLWLGAYLPFREKSVKIYSPFSADEQCYMQEDVLGVYIKDKPYTEYTGVTVTVSDTYVTVTWAEDPGISYLVKVLMKVPEVNMPIYPTDLIATCTKVGSSVDVTFNTTVTDEGIKVLKTYTMEGVSSSEKDRITLSLNGLECINIPYRYMVIEVDSNLANLGSVELAGMDAEYKKVTCNGGTGIRKIGFSAVFGQFRKLTLSSAFLNGLSAGTYTDYVIIKSIKFTNKNAEYEACDFKN